MWRLSGCDVWMLPPLENAIASRRDTHRGGLKKKKKEAEEEEERERRKKKPKKKKKQDRSVSTSFWIWARGRLADPTAASGAEAGSSYIMLILCLSFSLPFFFSGVCPSNSSALLDSGTSNKSTRKDWPTAFTDVNANELRAANRRRARRRWVVLRFPWELWKQGGEKTEKKKEALGGGQRAAAGTVSRRLPHVAQLNRLEAALKGVSDGYLWANVRIS